MFETLLGDVLKGPVPVVIIVGTEMIAAAHDLAPGRLIEDHSHVVLAADPRRNLNLQVQDYLSVGQLLTKPHTH